MRVPYPTEQELNVFSTSSKAAFTLVVAALVVACIRSWRLLGSRDVGEEERYFVGETVPFIKAAALGGGLDLMGEERDENRPLDGLEGSAPERTEERPGTVFMGEEEELEAAPEPTMTALYGRVELYMFREDLGEAGGVMAMDDLSSRAAPPPVVIGEVLADSAARPFTDMGSRALLPGEYRMVGGP